MWCIWTELKSGTWERIYVSSSADGITWAAPTLIFDIAHAAADKLMSPSVLWDGAQFLMYVCDFKLVPHVINRFVCATMDGVWAADAAPTVLFANPEPITSKKHVDVILYGGVYYMIYMDVDSGINAGLYFGSSADGITFTLDPNFRLPAQVGVWDYLPYRASLVADATGFDIYYSGFDVVGTTAKISKTRYNLP